MFFPVLINHNSDGFLFPSCFITFRKMKLQLSIKLILQRTVCMLLLQSWFDLWNAGFCINAGTFFFFLTFIFNSELQCSNLFYKDVSLEGLTVFVAKTIFSEPFRQQFGFFEEVQCNLYWPNVLPVMRAAVFSYFCILGLLVFLAEIHMTEFIFLHPNAAFSYCQHTKIWECIE